MKFIQRIQSPDQRTAYRVQAGGEGAQLWVALAAGPAELVIDDISVRGCAFVVSPEQAEEIEDRSVLILRLLVGGEGMPQLFIRARARNRLSDGESVRIGVEFLEPERLYAQLKEPQWLFFNRRGAFRVPPADKRGRALRANFYLPGKRKPKSIVLHDLSSSGLGIDLRPEDDVEFPTQRSIRVTFVLPIDEREVELKVRFVHKTPVNGRRRIGFQIDMEATRDLEEQTETILRYVLERQRQILNKG